MKQLSWRTKHLGLSGFALALFGLALYFQFGLGLTPCPLCIVQRLAVLLLALTGLVAAWHQPQKSGRRAYTGLILLWCTLGASYAIRQLWLQHLPPSDHTVCAPGLGYLMALGEWTEIFHQLLYGAADCAEVAGRFLGLSIPGWTLIAFILYGAAAVYPCTPARNLRS